MYLTIGLIVGVPVSVRAYRYMTAKRTKRRLREQFGDQGCSSQPARPERGDLG